MNETEERERFEKWVTSLGGRISRKAPDDCWRPDEYVMSDVQLAWEAWQQALEDK